MYGLSSQNVIRHYDVTGKMCPKYYVKHEQAWREFCNKVQECLKSVYLIATRDLRISGCNFFYLKIKGLCDFLRKRF